MNIFIYTYLMKKLIIIVLLIILVIAIKVSANETPLDYGIRMSGKPEISQEIWKECETATNQTHCFGVAMSIAKAESYWSYGDHGYFGMMSSNDKSTKRWVVSYNRYWYKATNWHFFYWEDGKLWKSQYCHSEESSGTAVGCPNGRKNFDSFFTEYSRLYLWKVIDPPLSEKIAKPMKITKVCRQVGTIQKNEYIQLDTPMGAFRKWIKDLFIGDKVFICKDL